MENIIRAWWHLPRAQLPCGSAQVPRLLQLLQSGSVDPSALEKLLSSSSLPEDAPQPSAGFFPAADEGGGASALQHQQHTCNRQIFMVGSTAPPGNEFKESSYVESVSAAGQLADSASKANAIGAPANANAAAPLQVSKGSRERIEAGTNKEFGKDGASGVMRASAAAGPVSKKLQQQMGRNAPNVGPTAIQLPKSATKEHYDASTAIECSTPHTQSKFSQSNCVVECSGAVAGGPAHALERPLSCCFSEGMSFKSLSHGNVGSGPISSRLAQPLAMLDASSGAAAAWQHQSDRSTGGGKLSTPNGDGDSGRLEFSDHGVVVHRRGGCITTGWRDFTPAVGVMPVRPCLVCPW